jgi:hypothetical protein
MLEPDEIYHVRPRGRWGPEGGGVLGLEIAPARVTPFSDTIASSRLHYHTTLMEEDS